MVSYIYICVCNCVMLVLVLYVESMAEKTVEGGGGPNRPEEESILMHDALERTIFVGNLPESTTKKELKSLFKKYGVVESVRFRSVPVKEDAKVPRRVAAASGAIDTDKGSFHAYVRFESDASVEDALQENMKMFGERHIRVDRAAINKMRVKIVGSQKGLRAAAEMVGDGYQVKYDVGRSVFVGNVPIKIEDEDLIRFFIAGMGSGSEGLLEAVRIVRDPKTLMGKGIAFVLFRNRAARQAALKLDGKALQSRKLRITPAKSNPTSESQQYSRVKKSAPWQGATATRSGRVRGAPARSTPSSAPRPNPARPKKRTGKRPAVAARKLAQKRKA